MENKQNDSDLYMFASEDGEDQVKAERVSKIDNNTDMYLTEDGEPVLVSTEEISSAEMMHKFYNSKAFESMRDNLSKLTNEDLEDYEEDEQEDESDEIPFEKLQLLSYISEDISLESVERVAKIIEDLTPDQVEKLGPDGVEQLFTALSKFYYNYIQSTNPLWEVAQDRLKELYKWQKLYVDKYYHK